VLTHAYIGTIGALINTSTLPFRTNVALLLGGLVVVLWDLWAFDLTLACYLLKTTAGDVLAGKVDSSEWQLGLGAIVAGMVGVMGWVSTSTDATTICATAAVAEYARIFVVLATVQFVCEFGDAHLERWTFFRHRYSFEVLTAIVLITLPLNRHERRVVEHDLVICLWYRVANYVVLIARQVRTPGLAMVIFKLYGLANYGVFGRRFVRISDPALATQVLQASVQKGDCIESRIATPAWAPVVSLESVDGECWQRMRRGFAQVLGIVGPRARTLSAIAQRRTDTLLEAKMVINAEVITRLSVEIFLELLFGDKDFTAEVDVIAAASWEWRKEIACKGKGIMATKLAAIDAVVSLVRRDAEMWDLFEDEWVDPERYSLLVQPFLISPAINTCDIMVALESAGKDVNLDDAIRRAHPFPILERLIKDPVKDRAGRVLVPRNTQVLLFAEDFEDVNAWPIFSSGRRACAGAHFARSYLAVLRSSLLGNPLFQPKDGHRFSGRNNDTMKWDEMVYFARVILKLCLFSKQISN